MSFGIKLKKLRQDNDLTQEELAKKIDTSRSNIANYENDKNMPSVDVLDKLSKEFNCSIDYLMDKSETKNINSNSFEDLKKYYEDKVNIILKNKYINEFIKLNLSNFEVENLIKIIYSEENLREENYYHLLNSMLSILSMNHSTETINQVKDLIKNYYEEKIDLLEEEITTIKNQVQKDEQKLKEEHINELHHAISGKNSASLEENVDALLDFMNKNNLNDCFMCPVYGQIAAGQPNWAEECIEGYLPIDPNLMGIINPEEHFFLRVNGESMNKIIKNGAFALIHKQDNVEDGEIAVVLVDGYNATLKKFTKQGNLVILEPQSNDESFKIQAYDKNTSIKILGKYVGKMEINK